VQSAGHAYPLIGQELKDEFHRNGPLQLLLLRYTQALITQMASVRSFERAGDCSSFDRPQFAPVPGA
jgi:hypothetical protein